jgi:hypothetical protein
MGGAVGRAQEGTQSLLLRRALGTCGAQRDPPSVGLDDEEAMVAGSTFARGLSLGDHFPRWQALRRRQPLHLDIDGLKEPLDLFISGPLRGRGGSALHGESAR